MLVYTPLVLHRISLEVAKVTKGKSGSPKSSSLKAPLTDKASSDESTSKTLELQTKQNKENHTFSETSDGSIHAKNCKGTTDNESQISEIEGKIIRSNNLPR